MRRLPVNIVPAKAGTLADLHDATRRSDRIAKHSAAGWRETLRVGCAQLWAPIAIAFV